MIHRINTDKFHYHSGTKTFTQEASTLGPDFESVICNAVWSPRMNFNLVSAKTGNVVEMVLDRIERDGEYEILLWKFRPLGCEAFNNLIIFND